jgi:hypothetical protein
VVSWIRSLIQLVPSFTLAHVSLDACASELTSRKVPLSGPVLGENDGSPGDECVDQTLGELMSVKPCEWCPGWLLTIVVVEDGTMCVTYVSCPWLRALSPAGNS